jgi:hypothetical protein
MGVRSLAPAGPSADAAWESARSCVQSYRGSPAVGCLSQVIRRGQHQVALGRTSSGSGKADAGLPGEGTASGVWQAQPVQEW